MRSGFAATFLGLALLLAGSASAQADPGFRLTESAAKPGDTVHFSISDADDVTSYTIEVAGRTVTQGANRRRDDISGAFTMPELGGSTRMVAVEARMKEPDETTKVSRALQYLAPPAPAPVQPPAPAPEPPAAPQPAPAAQPAHPPLPEASPAYEPPHATQPAKPVSRRSAPHRPESARRTRTRTRRAVSRNRRKPARRTRKRRAPRTAALFDGVPESTRGDAAAGRRSLNAIVPPTAVLTSATADPDAGGVAAAVLVPALLGLLALVIAGTALLRHRRVRR
jgi:hypothetical protein